MPLVIAVAAVAPAAAPAARYGGRTDQRPGRHGTQRLPSSDVAFSLRAGRVHGFSIPWAVRCTSFDEPGTPEEPLLDRMLVTQPLPVRGGRFSAEGHYAFRAGPRQRGRVAFFRLRGAIAGARASGTLTIQAQTILDGQNPDGDCRTHRAIRWHARAGARGSDLRPPRSQRPLPHLDGLVVYARRSADGPAALWQTVPGSARSDPLGPPPAGASDAAPAVALLPEPLVFERTAGGVPQLYAKGRFGTVPDTRFGGGRITDAPGGARQPAVSSRFVALPPVAFSAGSAADCSLWRVDPAGGHLRRLTDHGGRPGCDDAPAWSPDGRRLAFRRTLTDAAGAPLAVEYLVLDVRSGRTRPLDFGPAAPSAFSWAPGRQIAFVGSDGIGSDPALQVMNPDGSGRRTLLRSAALTGRPAWSPIRDRVAIVLRREDGSTDLGAVDVASGALTDLTQTPGVSEDDPAWSYQVQGLGGGEPGPSVHVRSERPRRHRGRRHKRHG